MYCGERQVKARKGKAEIKIPTPRQLPSGKWNIYLRSEGQSITEDTPEKCEAKARAIRAGFLEAKNQRPKLTYDDALAAYIDANDGVLSPSTLDGYQRMRRNRFKPYHDADFFTINWQKAINAEAKICSAKTVHNAWGLVSAVMRYNDVTPPDINMPPKESKELPWLNYQQIEIFLPAIYGKPCELAALLALHSLRRSELLAVTPQNIDADGIHVNGSLVYAEGKLVKKGSNKTLASKRTVPIMIPRLQALIDSSAAEPDQPLISSHFNSIREQIDKVCKQAGLPLVGFHGLRRSFASLAYHLGWSERQAMQIGGWSDWQTMHKVYIKLDNTDIQNAADKMRRFYNFTDEISDVS